MATVREVATEMASAYGSVATANGDAYVGPDGRMVLAFDYDGAAMDVPWVFVDTATRVVTAMGWHAAMTETDGWDFVEGAATDVLDQEAAPEFP